MLKLKSLILCVLSTWASVAATADEVQQNKPSLGSECTTISSKIERLACFDQLFATPIDKVDSTTADAASPYPKQFRVALASEKKREKGMTFLPGHAEGETRNVWLTAPAIGAVPPRPVLMISCIDDISRVELMMPVALEEGWVEVGIRAGGANRVSQRWLSDDTGYIFRSGRGVPAILVMKALLRGGDITLTSANKSIDGLQFDARGLRKQIEPLRKSCGW